MIRNPEDELQFIFGRNAKAAATLGKKNDYEKKYEDNGNEESKDAGRKEKLWNAFPIACCIFLVQFASHNIDELHPRFFDYSFFQSFPFVDQE